MTTKDKLESALATAIERDDVVEIQKLAFTPSLDVPGIFSAWLSYASRLGRLNALGALLDLSTNIDWANDDGETAFSYACAYNQPEAATLLHSRGANINTVDSGGGKPLDWAVCHCPPEFRRWLRSVGGERNLDYEEWPCPPSSRNTDIVDDDGG